MPCQQKNTLTITLTVPTTTGSPTKLELKSFNSKYITTAISKQLLTSSSCFQTARGQPHNLLCSLRRPCVLLLVVSFQSPPAPLKTKSYNQARLIPSNLVYPSNYCIRSAWTPDLHNKYIVASLIHQEASSFKPFLQVPRVSFSFLEIQDILGPQQNAWHI